MEKYGTGTVRASMYFMLKRLNLIAACKYKKKTYLPVNVCRQLRKVMIPHLTTSENIHRCRNGANTMCTV